MKYLFLLVGLPLISCGSTSETWQVNGLKVPCDDVGVQECFQVKKDSSDTWEYVYSDIEDFYFEPGYDYVLKVKVSDRREVLQDASAKRYKLDEIISKKKMEVSLNGSFQVLMLGNKHLQDGAITVIFDNADKRVYGMNICNRFSGSFSVEDDAIKLSPVMTTRKKCAQHELERQFLNLLKQVDAFAIADDKLYLRNGNNVLITAKRSSDNE
ncbi:MAG: DUF4377 domain-containing protein [Leeuwenhoekiella sp.]